MKPFKFRCPHCYRQFTATDEMRGKEFDCINCGELNIVPLKPEDLIEKEEPAPQAEEPMELKETTCTVCKGPLDVLGECPSCRKKAEMLAEEKLKNAPRPRRGKPDRVMAKVMNARRPGMEKIMPVDKKAAPSEKKEAAPGPATSRSERRRMLREKKGKK